MLSSNPRVGEIKLEEIVECSMVRKLDDSTPRIISQNSILE